LSSQHNGFQAKNQVKKVRIARLFLIDFYKNSSILAIK
jgi:hypothetical protein